MKLSKTKILEKDVFYYQTDDKFVGQRIALGKYEPYETELILRQVKKGDVVIDVGANVGYYTVLLANKVENTGRVYAFEPDETNFAILKKNIEADKLKNVVLIKAAVGSKNEEKILYKSKDNFGDHKLVKIPLGSADSPFEEREKVKVIKLDDYFKNEKIDLIKVDTQGWEPAVFEGAKKIIEKNKPTIFFEYSPASYKLAKLDSKKMMDRLGKIYKKFWWIDEWLYIYKSLNKEKIDRICETNKTGYADLWVKKRITFRDQIDGFKNLKVKQWIKRKLDFNPKS
jgi:FkbM family methyltransferase